MVCKLNNSSVSTRKLKFVLALMIMLFSLPAISQIQHNILFYNNGRVTDTHENRLDYGQLKYFMQDNDKALEHLHLSRACLYAGTGAAFVGLTALYIAEAAVDEGGPVFWTFLGFGTILGIGGAIVGTVGSKRNIKKAVSIYNSSLMGNGTSHKYDIKFGITSSGIGLAVQF